TKNGKEASKKNIKKRIVVNLRKEEDKANFTALKNKWELQFDYEVMLESFRLAAKINQEGLLKEKEIKERFENLKKKKVIDDDFDMLRLIVHRYFELEDSMDELAIEPSLEKIIDNFLTSRYYMMKHGIFNKKDFVNRAILNFYERIRSEINLNNPTFRSSLTEKERLVAQALVELPYRLSSEGMSFGVTLSKISEYAQGQSENMTSEEIRKILINFVNQQLVTQERVKDETYYTIPL
ncbi:MAG: hypothetical protein ACFFD4_39195, partial [Candidatus Odinarchaeota archaeon]